MKLTALAALVLAGTDVRLETAGVRIGDALVQGQVLEVRSSAAGALLASGSSIEPLASSLDVQISAERTLTLEPGVRVTRTEGGCRISTHDARPIRLAAADETFLASGPVEVVVTADGWLVGDRAIAGAALRAGLGRQDEESNLNKMLQEKDKMRGTTVPRLSTRTHRRYRGNPLTNSNAADSVSVRQITQISPSGAP